MVVCGVSGSCIRLMMIGDVFVGFVVPIGLICVFPEWLVGLYIWFFGFVLVLLGDPNCGEVVILGMIGVLSFPFRMCLVALVEFLGGKEKVSMLPKSFVLEVCGGFGRVSCSVEEGSKSRWCFGAMGVMFGFGLLLFELVMWICCVCDGTFVLSFGGIVFGVWMGVDLFVWCGGGVEVVCGGGRVWIFVGFGICV